jgi:hypothetical protein
MTKPHFIHLLINGRLDLALFLLFMCSVTLLYLYLHAGSEIAGTHSMYFCYFTINGQFTSIVVLYTHHITRITWYCWLHSFSNLMMWEVSFPCHFCQQLDFVCFRGHLLLAPLIFFHTRVWTQGLTLARKVLCTTWAMPPSLFCLSYFWIRFFFFFFFLVRAGLGLKFSYVSLTCSWDPMSGSLTEMGSP